MPNADNRSLDQLWKGQDGNTADDLNLCTITGGVTQGYYEQLKLNNKPVRMESDTGPAVSVMSYQQWRIMTNGEPVRPYQGKCIQDTKSRWWDK